MKILIVEDDDRIAKPLAEDLRHQQYVVDLAFDGEAGWDFMQAADYDLVLLDLMLPKLDGVSLCQRLRQSGYSGLVLMLTAKDTLTDKVMGLDAGADDYLVKPFELDELSARIRALSRRPPQVQTSVLRAGQLMLSPMHHEVYFADQRLDLTPKEFLLLEFFLQHPQQVFTRTMLLDKLWEFDQSSSEGTVKTHIGNLRGKLKAVGCHEKLIDNVYGVGYCLRPVQTSSGQ